MLHVLWCDCWEDARTAREKVTPAYIYVRQPCLWLWQGEKMRGIIFLLTWSSAATLFCQSRLLVSPKILSVSFYCWRGEIWRPRNIWRWWRCRKKYSGKMEVCFFLEGIKARSARPLTWMDREASFSFIEIRAVFVVAWQNCIRNEAQMALEIVYLVSCCGFYEIDAAAEKSNTFSWRLVLSGF